MRKLLPLALPFCVFVLPGLLSLTACATVHNGDCPENNIRFRRGGL